MADYASEGGHFYTRAGEPAYTIVGKNGIERNTTLRDARKMDLVPGATTIIRCAAAPALEAWKQEQLLLAALTLPKLEGESEKSWLSRVKTDSRAEGKGAADRGTDIHAALELAKKYRPYDKMLQPWVIAVEEAIHQKCGLQTWKAEKSYAHKFGYGCKIDLHSDAWVIDYKGKDDGAQEDLYLYDEHYMQLAACRLAAGIPHARCAIVFFGRQTPWAKLIEAEEGELGRGWDCFEALLTYYQAKNRLYKE
jgi:hypothetical protein